MDTTHTSGLIRPTYLSALTSPSAGLPAFPQSEELRVYSLSSPPGKTCLFLVGLAKPGLRLAGQTMGIPEPLTMAVETQIKQGVNPPRPWS